MQEIFLTWNLNITSNSTDVYLIFKKLNMNAKRAIKMNSRIEY